MTENIGLKFYKEELELYQWKYIIFRKYTLPSEK